jgi:hypothetical protein
LVRAALEQQAQRPWDQTVPILYTAQSLQQVVVAVVLSALAAWPLRTIKTVNPVVLVVAVVRQMADHQSTAMVLEEREIRPPHLHRREIAAAAVEAKMM